MLVMILGVLREGLDMSAAPLTDHGPAVWFFDALGAVRADQAATNGAYGLAEIWAPSGHGSTLHTHTREDESFFVLDGELRVWHGDDEPFAAGPGQLAVLRRNRPHAFVVTSDIAHFCQISSPVGFEEFIRLLGRPAERYTLPTGSAISIDPEQIMSVLTELGVVVHGPRSDDAAPTPS
jgi:mannose-6-phosphate isomerase-like protein (cupin superfamily)